MTDSIQEILRKRIVSHILHGGELNIPLLQVICAVLSGETDLQTLRELQAGSRSMFEFPKTLKGYKAVVAGGRPTGDKEIRRNEQIAYDFEILRATLGAEAAYAKLSSESKERYGVALSIERVRACVTRGRKSAASLKAALEKAEETRRYLQEKYPELGL